MDETLQLFVDGRAGRILDVMIDGAGAGCGVLAVIVGVWMVGYKSTKIR